MMLWELIRGICCCLSFLAAPDPPPGRPKDWHFVPHTTVPFGALCSLRPWSAMPDAGHCCCCCCCRTSLNENQIEPTVAAAGAAAQLDHKTSTTAVHLNSTRVLFPYRCIDHSIILHYFLQITKLMMVAVAMHTNSSNFYYLLENATNCAQSNWPYRALLLLLISWPSCTTVNFLLPLFLFRPNNGNIINGNDYRTLNTWINGKDERATKNNLLPLLVSFLVCFW